MTMNYNLQHRHICAAFSWWKRFYFNALNLNYIGF